MIVLPIYLQMVLEYNAMQAGLSLAPLSLSMFGVALLAGKRAGKRRPAGIIRVGFALLTVGRRAADPDRPAGQLRLVPRRPAADRRVGAGPARVAAQQLHPVADLGGAGQRGRRRELGGGLVRAVVRPGVRRRDHAGRRSRSPSPTWPTSSTVLPPGAAAAGRGRAGARRRGDEQHAARTAARRSSPPRSRTRSSASTPRLGIALQVAPADPDPRRPARVGQLVPHDAPAGPHAIRAVEGMALG